MLRIAVAEDELEYQQRLKEFLTRYSKEHTLELNVTVYSSGSELIRHLEQHYDIILLDIMMPGINGMETAELIRQKDDQVVLIFITQMAQYAINGYSVGALDFVLKPITYEGFALRFARAVERAKSREGGKITLMVGGGMKRIKTIDLLFVEIQNHMLHYHTKTGEYIIRGTMLRAEKELSPYGFAKCNHWYLVNLAHVTEVNKDMVTVADHQLEISRRNRTAFLGAVTDYLGGNT